MAANRDLARRLLRELPDEPRWIDVRGMLAHDHVEVAGGAPAEPGFVARVVHGALSVIAVAGAPGCDALFHAIPGTTELTPIVAQVDNAKHIGECLQRLPGSPWSSEPMTVRRMAREPERAAKPAEVDVRLLRADDPLDHVPPGLRHELTHALTMAPVSVAIAQGRAASFCYPCWRTETLWDVSIDTVEEFRGQSLAAIVVWDMVDRMRREGREPVWCALASNVASNRLASKLGFVPVDTIVVFSRGHWAFLTRGFQA